jgi:hypothetical protein
VYEQCRGLAPVGLCWASDHSRCQCGQPFLAQRLGKRDAAGGGELVDEERPIDRAKLADDHPWLAREVGQTLARLTFGRPPSMMSCRTLLHEKETGRPLRIGLSCFQRPLLYQERGKRPTHSAVASSAPFQRDGDGVLIDATTIPGT